MAKLVNEHFIPVKIHIKERPQDFGRFKAQWTPTLIVAEADGTERYRKVGHVPVDDFLAQLQLGLAKTAFSRGQFEDARRAFQAIVEQHPEADAAPAALYWSAVSASARAPRSSGRSILRACGPRKAQCGCADPGSLVRQVQDSNEYRRLC